MTDEVPPRPVESTAGWADTTPVDESAVADLVMDMLPSSSASSASVTTDYSCELREMFVCFIA